MSASFAAARRLLEHAIEQRVCPAACVEVGQASGPLWQEALGALTYAPDAELARLGTLFDLASLTKPVAATTVVMRLEADGRLDLDDLVVRWLPAWNAADRRQVTVRDLLEHCAGLPAHAALFDSCRTPEAIREAVCTVPLEYAPRGASVYSDLGFMLLGWIAERAGRATLDVQWNAAVADAGTRFAAHPLVFRPPAAWRSRVAPTRHDDWRGRLLVGEVDDNNAWALGGVAGHAGLFGSVRAVGIVAREWLGGLSPGGTGSSWLGPRDRLVQWLQPSTVPGSSRACGWDLMRPTSSCGTRMSAAAFGHTGFTGTSLWVDPVRDRYAVLLTNRVHPRAGSSDGIQQLRRAFHDAVWAG